MTKLLANGITGIRDMGAPPDDVLRLRRETRERVTVGPHLMVAGPLLEGPLPPKLATMPMLRSVNTAGDAAGTVRNLKQAGVDYIKVDGSLPRDTYFAVAAAAKRQRIPGRCLRSWPFAACGTARIWPRRTWPSARR